jgi:glucose-1-phosphate adenylyltransferase
VVEGAVERSILSPDVVIEPGASVRDSVIMHGCRIQAGAALDRVILDKNVQVGRDARVGIGPAIPNTAEPESLSSGVTVVGKGTRLPPGIRVGRNCILAAAMAETDFRTSEIPSGATVSP